MAVSHYVGQVIPNENDYFWKNDVVHLIRKRSPQEQFVHCMKSFLDGEITVHQHEDSIFLHSDSLWLMIDKDGRIEFGESAA